MCIKKNSQCMIMNSQEVITTLNPDFLDVCLWSFYQLMRTWMIFRRDGSCHNLYGASISTKFVTDGFTIKPLFRHNKLNYSIPINQN